MSLKVCTRCIYDERLDQITFDKDGICNYCHQVDDLIEMYGTGNSKGKAIFEDYIKEIKNAGKRKKYDVIIGVSGGTDSSFMLHLAIQHGLRPLAVHYDNTWNTAIATQNIQKMTSALDIDLYTHVVDNREADDIYKAFLYSGVSEIEASTDLALAEVMYRAASKFNVKYIFEGHSFIEEGITPLGKNYFDGKYIKGIHKKFGKLPMKTYPLMTFSRFLYWSIFKRIRKIRPFWYIHYNKQEAKDFLSKEYGWEYYGGHHLENRMTAFCHSFYFPNKFKVDYRNNTLSAEVRNKKTTREEALKIYNTPPYLEENLLDYFKKRLSLSDKEFESIMNQPLRYWYEFPTYKKRFERLRPLFFILAKTNLVPMSFYLKYCFPTK
ncbi:N-acetyl sugar amidotransferase [Flavobacteriaceae bacterium]|nr:N-acetyl sugar amidotransferase [Flavobacteriaceae bacterium]MDB4715210.1 N-acetyl sugar amidotransferase [Flavobacteriaceae bacterium]